MPEDYIDIEELRRLMRNGGLNLAGQQTPDGTYGYYSPDFSYGSYKIPYQDPTYSSGYEYARTIAGGMPFEDVVAPGMSFSPDQPMGYTQADLRKKEIYGDFDGVMPVAPTKGTPVEASYETMPDAPVGTPAPERYVPGQTAFPGIPDFLKDLDFSSLQDLDFSSLPGARPVEPKEDFFKVDQNLFNFEEIADKIDMDEVAKIDIEKIDIPESVSLFSDILKEPALGEPVSKAPVLPSIFDQPTAPAIRDLEPHLDHIRFGHESTPEPAPVMPTPAPAPAIMPKGPVQAPMNFTALPPLPQSFFENIPKPQPLPMPQVPAMPQITYTPPVPSFVQPRIEDIVSPIRAGSLRNFQQPGLFSF